MYSTVGLLKNSKHSGKLIGTHQRLDKIARALFARLAPEDVDFPTYKEIVHFEGTRGPDGLKRKSPGVDEPMHFILPDDDDGKLVQMIKNHHHNLKIALKDHNRERSAFEASWLAHAITDGLTPAHHFPYEQAISELMSDKDYVTIFGQPIKGIMRGDSLKQTAHNNWLYWGPEGYMTKHIAYEYRVAMITKRKTMKSLTPKLSRKEISRLKDYSSLDLTAEFYNSLKKIHKLKMYDTFREEGWTTDLSRDTAQILLPEIVKMITIGWLSALPEKPITEKPIADNHITDKDQNAKA